MKKYLRSFVCLNVFLVLFPVLCAARTDIVSNPVGLSEKTSFNGEFTLSVQKDGAWEKIGTLFYDKHLKEQTLSLSRHIGASGKVSIKIEQHGGGAAHIDSVFLNGKPPIEVKSINNGLVKLSRKDSDVIDAFSRTVELVFDAGAESNTLSLAARIESTVISKLPFQFPTNNTYRTLDNRSSFYAYRLDSEQGSMQLDGTIGETMKRKPFFKEFSKTGSGHPSGYTYGWVWNDDKNLYVSMDFTPDNTMDGDKDYAKVYTNVDGKIKEFKVSVPEQKWGIPGFTYTGNADYQHKTYEFKLPFSEIFSDNIRQSKDIQMAFAAYGTATPSCPSQAEITYTCPFTTAAPTIDGTASSTEWPDNPRFNIPVPINTFFYCMVDGANLYILVDAVGDTTQSTTPLACDECLLSFTNGTIPSLAEIHSANGTSNTSFIPVGGEGRVGFGSSQNSATPHRLYEWKFPFSSISTTSGGQIYFSAPAFPKAACGAGASMPYDGATENDNVWPPCFTGALSTWGLLQLPADGDGDGIPDAVEDAAPNSGDGNGDSIPDKSQRNVTSLPSATGSGYLTLQTDAPVAPSSASRSSANATASGDCQNSNVQALTEASQSQQDDGFKFPFGLLSFKVEDCASVSETALRTSQDVSSLMVTVYYHGGASLDVFTYRKYGPFPDPLVGTLQWYTMPGVTFGTATVGSTTVPIATFLITDNGTGDDDPTVGVIVDQGGPGQSPLAIPTMTEWGMIIFIALAGLGSVYHLRRQRRA